jgi:hypothetical protein
MNAITKPAHWTVGNKTPDKKYTVARVREFFAVLKSEDKPTTWAVEFINGKVVKAESSVDAGAKGRDFRDAQKAKGAKVERPAAKKTAAKPAAKTAAKAPAKAPAKPAAKKPTAKDKVNGRATKAVSPARSSRTRKTATARVAK